MSPTQKALLAALRDVRALALSTEAAADARALGGLTDGERWQRMAARPDGEYVNGQRIRGLKIGTWAALARAGLVECRNGWWGAR